MQIDRRAQSRLNAVLGGVVTLVVGVFAWFVFNKSRLDQPYLPPNVGSGLRNAQHAGYFAAQAGNYAEAEKQYRIAVQLGLGRKDLKAALAYVLASQGKLKEAWEIYKELPIDLDRSVDRPQGSLGALAWYADLSVLFGDPAKGEEIARSISHRAESPLISRNRVLAMAHLAAPASGDTDSGEIEGHIRRTLELQPSWILPHLAMAKLDMDAGREQEGAKELVEAKQLAQPGSCADKFTLARFEASQGMDAVAKKDFAEAERLIQPSDTAAWLEYLSSDRELQKPTHTVAILKKVVQSARGNNLEGQLLLAEYYYYRGQRKLASPLIESLLRATPPQNTSRYGRIANLAPKDRAISLLRQTIPYAKGTDRKRLDKQLSTLLSPPNYRGGGIFSPMRFPRPLRWWLGFEMQFPSAR
jgi:hypothetical protein